MLGLLAICSMFIFTGCIADLIKGFERIPAEPAEFESAAKDAGFTVTEENPQSVAALIGAQTLQKAEKNGCALYFAVYVPDFFIEEMNAGGVDEESKRRVRKNYIKRIDGDRKSNARSEWNMPGFYSISKSGSGNYFFAAANSNTVMYIDGVSNCKDSIKSIKEKLNY